MLASTTPEPVRKQPLQLAAGATGSRSQVLVNPGDTKNCADFASFDEAKAWYDKYFPAFGDVAKLDGDGDGVPCQSLLKSKRLPSR